MNARGGYQGGNPAPNRNSGYSQGETADGTSGLYDYSNAANYNAAYVNYQDYSTYPPNQNDASAQYATAGQNYNYSEQIDPNSYHYDPATANYYQYPSETAKPEVQTFQYQKEPAQAETVAFEPTDIQAQALHYQYPPQEAAKVDDVQYHVDPTEQLKTEKNEQFVDHADVAANLQYQTQTVPVPAPGANVPAPATVPVPEQHTAPSTKAPNVNHRVPADSTIVAVESVKPARAAKKTKKTSNAPNETAETPAEDNEVEDDPTEDLNLYADAKKFPLDDVFLELSRFRERHGHSNIPVTHPAYLRIVDNLVANGFEDEMSARWENRFEILKAYKDENGDCDVPAEHPVIGSWVIEQRKLHAEGKADGASRDRFKRMDELGFEWEPPLWDQRLEELKEFKRNHGHCDVPIDHPDLGIWVVNQRFNLADMPKERVDALDAIGFSWNHNRKNRSDDKWDRQYENLLKFIRENGHCNVPATYRHSPLGTWVGKQREEYKKLQNKQSSQLSRYRIDKLNEVGFQWKLQQWAVIPWEERFEELKKFKEQHGHCKVPRNHPYFGNWPMYQRAQYKLYKDGKPAKITKEKVEKLIAIGFLKQDTMGKNQGYDGSIYAWNN